MADDKPQEITNSRILMSVFLKDSVGIYIRNKYLGDEIPQDVLVNNTKEHLTSLLNGMLKSVPKNSPNREQISNTVKILKTDLGNYVKSMDNILTKERDTLLNKPNNEFAKLDPEEASIRAAQKVGENSIFVKASKVFLNEGESYWKRATEIFKSIGASRIAAFCMKKYNLQQEKASRRFVGAVGVDTLRKALATADIEPNAMKAYNTSITSPNTKKASCARE